MFHSGIHLQCATKDASNAACFGKRATSGIITARHVVVFAGKAHVVRLQTISAALNTLVNRMAALFDKGFPQISVRAVE